MIWVDPIERARHGRKRHAYRLAEATAQVTGGGETAYRVCGSNRGGTSITMSTEDLRRVEDTEFAVFPNACQTCINSLDLAEYRANNQLRSGTGADTVDYDPFGVFTDG
jgi:hypothetical protein